MKYQHATTNLQDLTAIIQPQASAFWDHYEYFEAFPNVSKCFRIFPNHKGMTILWGTPLKCRDEDGFLSIIAAEAVKDLERVGDGVVFDACHQ